MPLLLVSKRIPYTATLPSEAKPPASAAALATTSCFMAAASTMVKS